MNDKDDKIIIEETNKVFVGKDDTIIPKKVIPKGLYCRTHVLIGGAQRFLVGFMHKTIFTCPFYLDDDDFSGYGECTLQHNENINEYAKTCNISLDLE